MLMNQELIRATRAAPASKYAQSHTGLCTPGSAAGSHVGTRVSRAAFALASSAVSRSRNAGPASEAATSFAVRRFLAVGSLSSGSRRPDPVLELKPSQLAKPPTPAAVTAVVM